MRRGGTLRAVASVVVLGTLVAIGVAAVPVHDALARTSTCAGSAVEGPDADTPEIARDAYIAAITERRGRAPTGPIEWRRVASEPHSVEFADGQ